MYADKYTKSSENSTKTMFKEVKAKMKFKVNM